MRHMGIVRYVPHHRVYEFNARGWMVVADLGPVHGFWSVLMWHASCPDCEVCRDEN